jgi:hypothetical protein
LGLECRNFGVGGSPSDSWAGCRTCRRERRWSTLRDAPETMGCRTCRRERRWDARRGVPETMDHGSPAAAMRCVVGALGCCGRPWWSSQTGAVEEEALQVALPCVSGLLGG